MDTPVAGSTHQLVNVTSEFTVDPFMGEAHCMHFWFKVIPPDFCIFCGLIVASSVIWLLANLIHCPLVLENETMFSHSWYPLLNMLHFMCMCTLQAS